KDKGEEPTLHVRRLLYGRDFLELIGNSIENGAANLREDHLPAAKHYRDLNLVTTFQELLGGFGFHFPVLDVGLGAHPDLAEHRKMLAALGNTLLLCLLVFELAVVEKLADWWDRCRRNLDKV